MILLFDSSTPTCRLVFVVGSERIQEEWQADRQLAHGLLSYLYDRLAQHGFSADDIEGMGVFKGPGSFTGLRIGLTVLNTLADARRIPIVGVSGDKWQDEALDRLSHGDDDRIVLPLYGSDANITKPRK